MNSFWLVAFALQWALLLLLAALMVVTLRYLSSIQERIAQRITPVIRLEHGERIKDFVLPLLDGRSFRSGEVFGQGRHVMLLLLTATCGS